MAVFWKRPISDCWYFVPPCCWGWKRCSTKRDCQGCSINVPDGHRFCCEQDWWNCKYSTIAPLCSLTFLTCTGPIMIVDLTESCYSIVESSIHSHLNHKYGFYLTLTIIWTGGVAGWHCHSHLEWSYWIAKWQYACYNGIGPRRNWYLSRCTFIVVD